MIVESTMLTCLVLLSLLLLFIVSKKVVNPNKDTHSDSSASVQAPRLAQPKGKKSQVVGSPESSESPDASVQAPRLATPQGKKSQVVGSPESPGSMVWV